jgi:CHAT domain-containing protein
LHRFPLHIFFDKLYVPKNKKRRNYNLSYLPSIELGLQLEPSSPSNLNLLMINPSNLDSKLLNSFAESAGIYLRFCDASSRLPEILKGDPDARRKEVRRKLETDISSNFFHFLGHAYHDFKSPEKSALELTGRESLTLEYILKSLDFSNYYLVCLSACETGITGASKPFDEYVGLVSAFLETGASYVISSLWKVEDVSASFLMLEFYKFISTGMHPVVALEKAQTWLRTANRDQLSYWCRDHSIELNRILHKIAVDPREKQKLEASIRVIKDYSSYFSDLSISDLSDYPFKHPYYWSGFIITGLPPYQ